MKKKVDTVLVVGLGSIGRRHIGIISNIFPKINIIALRHKQCEKEDIKSLGLYKCVTSIDEAIATKPQIAIIANPATKHIETAKALALHGVNIMVEKPISTNSKDAQELVDICNNNNINLAVAYNLRFLPSLICFKQYIQLDLIGKIYSIRSEIGQYLPDWRPESDYRCGVSAKKSSGGGVLLELSHEIDYLGWIFGPISWVKSHTSKQTDLEIDVDDNASIILGFKGNEAIASLNMDFIRHDATRQCYAIGEKGTLFWNGITGKVSFFSKKNKLWVELFNSSPTRDYTYSEEIKSFVKSVEYGLNPFVTGEDGLETVLVVEAIEQSNLTNSKVFL